MKKIIGIWFHRFTTLCLVFAILSVFSTVVLALPDNKSLMGELVVTGRTLNGNSPFVLLNGEQVISGSTIFSSSTIATTESSSVTIELGKLGYVSLSPNSVLALNFDDKSISGTLSAGNIRVYNNEGVLVKIQTLNGLIENEAGSLASETLNISAENGLSNSSRQQMQIAGLPIALVGVAVIVAVTVLTLAVSNDLILSGNDSVGVSTVSVSPTR